MLVQTMSWDEMYRELTEDCIEVSHKMTVKLKVAMQIMVRKKQKQLSEVYHLVTKRRNEWSVAIAVTPTRRVNNFYLKSFDKIGVIAFSVFVLDGVEFLVKLNS